MSRNKLEPCAPSTVEITELMMPMHVNNLGNVFGGVVLSMVDKAGALAAMRHARGPCVTVSFDRVEFKLPIYAGEMVTCKARVTYVGRSSMEIWVGVEAEYPMTGEVRHTNDCYLTFVAVDADGRPTPVRGLLLENDDDLRRFEQGKLRREARRVLDAQLGED
jgi:acyl-CoA hydrolase